MNALQDTKKEIQSDIWHVIEKNAFKKFLFYNIASYQNSNTISLEKFVKSRITQAKKWTKSIWRIYFQITISLEKFVKSRDT